MEVRSWQQKQLTVEYLQFSSDKNLVHLSPTVVCSKASYQEQLQMVRRTTKKCLVEPSSIILTEDDIDPGCKKVTLQNLASCNKDELWEWLRFRGDSMRGIDTLKKAKLRVLEYLKNGTSKRILDPTPDMRWLTKKAKVLGVKLRQPQLLHKLENVPSCLSTDLGKCTTSGRSKLLTGVPQFTSVCIDNYYKKVNEVVSGGATKKVKKHFDRGEQLLEENFISTNTVHVKEAESLFCIKGLSSASLRKREQWITIAVNIADAQVRFSFCQCEAGKAGICAHAFALMKLLAKWVLDKRQEIPEESACTSRPCSWSVPQSRGKIDKSPISDLKFEKPQSLKKRNTNINDTDQPDPKRARSRGIDSILYDARSGCNQNMDSGALETLYQKLKAINPNMPAINVITTTHQRPVNTTFGHMPIGSILSIQCPLLSPNFNVYSSTIQATASDATILLRDFPCFPTVQNPDYQSNYVTNLSEKELQILNTLAVSKPDVTQIEQLTREQASCADWFPYRKNRFTASLLNAIKPVKTSRGMQTLAKRLCGKQPQKKNFLMQKKLDYGKYHEPIALDHYQKYCEVSNHPVSVHKSGLIIDCVNYVLGATPDGKVIDPSENTNFGILEIKCPEEYRDVDPKDICYASPDSCIEYDPATNSIALSKTHSYYDQLQMQLALTTQAWCDFVLYTSKGMVIDRVKFDQNHWDKLVTDIFNFYFQFYIKELFAEDE